ncbi:MAG: hypothetical protein KC609_26205 [Myxococcales bacterium]|nr:hypothetical protein [Myxococcales bacterium]
MKRAKSLLPPPLVKRIGLSILAVGVFFSPAPASAGPAEPPALRLLHTIEKPASVAVVGGHTFAFLASLGLTIKLRPAAHIDKTVIWPAYDAKALRLSVWPVAGSPKELRERLQRFVGAVTGLKLGAVVPVAENDLGPLYRTHYLFWLIRGLMLHALNLGQIRQSCGDFLAEQTASTLTLWAMQRLAERSDSLSRYVKRYFAFLEAVADHVPASTKKANWMTEVALWTFNGKALGRVRFRALLIRDLERSRRALRTLPKEPLRALFFEPSTLLRAAKPKPDRLTSYLGDRAAVRRCAAVASLYRTFDPRFIPRLRQLVKADASHSVRLLALATLLKHPRPESLPALEDCRSSLFLPLLPRCRKVKKKLEMQRKK